MRTLRALIAASTLLLVTATPSDASHEGGWFTLRDGDINESSGVARSSVRDDVLFTHNDSPDSGDVHEEDRFFAVDTRGCTLARYDLLGAEAIDWEDMTRGPEVDGTSVLWFGDIGDNLHQRADGIAVYKVREPRVNSSGGRASGDCTTIESHEIASTRYDLAYPDNPAEGPQDAETLLADPVTGQLFIVTKTYAGEANVYAASTPLVAGATNQLTLAAILTLPVSATMAPVPPEAIDPVDTAFDVVGRFNTTGGDISPDGRHVVVRTYLDAYEWDIPAEGLAAAFAPDRTPRHIEIPYRFQGEAATYTPDSNSLILTTEGAFSPVDRVAIDRTA